jgi:hypothetical protein
MIIELLGLMAAGLAVAIAHEEAHWLVWWVTGRNPELDLQWRYARGLAPRWTTAGDRVAAVAPYVMRVVLVLVGIEASDWTLVVFGGFQFGIPSAIDVQTALGRSEWNLQPV